MGYKNFKNRRLMENNEKVKLEDQKLKIVFINEGNSSEKSLEMYFSVENKDGAKVISLGIDPSLFSAEMEPSFMNGLYLDTVAVLHKVKELFETNKVYEGLYVLSKEEYKDYVKKVLGVKIEDQWKF